MTTAATAPARKKPKPEPSAETRGALLAQAQFLIRTRGYSAFSYADLADQAGITKAAVHYHFPTKEELVVLLVRDYVGQVRQILGDIDRTHADASARLRAYARLFADGFDQGMLPLCGALSAERSALPEAIHPQIHEIFQIQLDWLTRVLEAGRKSRSLRADIAPAREAMMLLSTLEGGAFVAWALERKGPVLASFETALQSIETGKAAARPTATRRRKITR